MSNDTETTYYKYNDKYFKFEEPISDSSSEYELLNPITDEPVVKLKSINKNNIITNKNDLKKFTNALDLCKRYNCSIEYVYDILIKKYKFTMQNLKKIINMHKISNFNKKFNLNNIIKNPFDFITEEHSLISFQKAENIAKQEGVISSFDLICLKWSYDEIRRENLGYVKFSEFRKNFDEFCRKKKLDRNKYIKIIENSCLFVEKDGYKYITTNYFYNLEKNMGDNLMLLNEKECKKFPNEIIHELITQYENNNKIQFNKEQKLAVINGINENVSCIIGYPGTGKTTIAECIIWIYQRLGLDSKHKANIDYLYDHNDYDTNDESSHDLSNNRKYCSGISVLAPTGKAQLNLFGKLKKYDLDTKISGTIHKVLYSTFPYISNAKKTFDEIVAIIISKTNIPIMFVNQYLFAAYKDNIRCFDNEIERQNYKNLKDLIYEDEKIKNLINKFENNDNYLNKKVKFIIIDECSMIDNFLFSELLKWALIFDCKLLFLGDENQLPSVGAGTVLENMINSNILSIVKLVDIKRQENKNGKLIDIIKMISKKKVVSVSHFDNNTIYFENKNDYINKDNSYNIENFDKLIQKYNIQEDNAKSLSYFKKTDKDFNTTDLNKIFQNKFNADKKIEIPKPNIYKDSIPLKVGDKIIRILNDYTEDVLHANGEEASIFKYDNKTCEVTIKYEYEEKYTNISIEELYDEFILAYAITIHKSQGSQYDIVVLFLPTDWKIINTKIIYTGISRAVKKCIIVSTPEIFEQIQKNPPEKRISFFMEDFNEYVIEYEIVY